MDKKPNIIFYFSDQQRWDTVGCYGQELDVTPTIDSLAQDGTKFEYAFTCQPVCGPARACLQSGVYATENGCYRNDIALPLNIPTIASYLNDAGYETAYVGKWHLASDKEHRLMRKAVPEERRGGYKDYWMASDVLEFTSHGYDGYVYNKENERVDFRGYRTDCINSFALDYINSTSGEKPFFLFVSHIEPHHQNDHMRYESPNGTRKNFKNYKVPGDLKGTLGDWRLHYPDYLSCCNRIDQNLGKVVDALKAKGIFDNTIIIYTSDHGSHFKTRNSEYKRSCHEGCIRVPLIIHGPGFEGGKVINDLVSLIDLPATVLGCAGIEKPEHFRGESLKKLVDGTGEKKRDHVFLQISESQIGRAIRTKDFKYSVAAKNADKPFSPVYKEDFLYDLNSDPHERKNLIKDKKYAKVKAELRKLLLADMKEIGEPEAEIIEK